MEQKSRTWQADDSLEAQEINRLIQSHKVLFKTTRHWIHWILPLATLIHPTPLKPIISNLRQVLTSCPSIHTNFHP